MMSRAAAFAVLFVALASLARCEEGPETAIAEKQPTEQRCTPNTTFSQDCNTCSCSADGTVAVCTNKTCLSRPTRDIPCTPGTMYKEKCNTCFCLQDGKSGGCTRKACPPGTY
ncbi:serine protease inhibitor I/II-like [Schistocerca serialis cubense]|uniref:serine protease inhibitor I/II-like n=1 Tax=Schistocerca serialis cubense TaxID=2023355 RepID=UPI00214E1D1F|nr:serine protease inhibitor I/II-like [Schistocerca serialis cubense]